MKLLKPILLTTFLLITCSCFCQRQWSNWYFNGHHMLTFNAPNQNAQLVSNFIPPAPNNFTNYVNSWEAGTSYSNPLTGEMKFIISRGLAFNRMYDMVNAPSFIRMCPGDTYAIHIVPFANNTNKFYIIQFQSASADMLAASSGLQVRCPNAIGLGYSVFDLSLDGGLGNFQSMNNIVTSGLPERIAVVKHANGNDTWVVVHGFGNAAFYAYLFTDAGVQPAIVSNIGPVITGEWSDADGNMAASHDGKILAAQKNGNEFLELYDFNTNTGALTNYRTLANSKKVDMIVFSPDDTKLYYLGNYENPGVFQYDMNAPDIAGSLFKLANDPTKSYWQMQLGLDGKIYISALHQPATEYFSIINCPNLPEYACNFKAKGMPVLSYGQFPTFINDYIQQPDAPPVTKFFLDNDTAICFGSYVIAAPVGWSSYKWNTGDTTRELSVNKPGNYFVLAGNAGFDCPSGYGAITVTTAAQPLNLGSDTVLCPGVPYTLTVPPNFSNVLWNDGTTDAVKTVTSYGEYIVTAVDQNGCRNWDTIKINYKYYPRAQFGADTTLCHGQTLLLQLEPQVFFGSIWNATYLWQDGTVKDSFRVTQPGTYWGTVSYQGCTVADTITVNYVNAQNVFLGSDTTLCTGDSLMLQVGIPAVNILWSTGATDSIIYVKNNGTYWVKVNNGSCTVSDTIQIRFETPPVVWLGNDTAICENQEILLSANVYNASYLWQDSSTGSSFTVTEEGNYWVEVNKNGCIVRDSMRVSYKPLPFLQLGADTLICKNGSLLLDASHPSINTYQWQNGSANAIFSVQNEGLYHLQVTGNNGCINSDTIQIATTPLPQFTLGVDTTICTGNALYYNFNIPGADYLWSNGSISNLFSVTTPDVYWLQVTQDGCAKRDSVNVGFKETPVIALGADTTLCEGTTKVLDVFYPGASLLWHNGSVAQMFTVSKPGTYSVTASLQGCIFKDTIDINYSLLPRFTLGPDLVLCKGQTFILEPQVGTENRMWHDGSTAPTYKVTKSGMYALTVTNQCGATKDEVQVTDGYCALLMPSAFTPNGDGLNDVFKVKYPQFIKSFHFEIFNRWGEIVYSSNDPQKGWNGAWKGIPQPTGNFIWQITLVDLDGKNEHHKGGVVLIR